MEDIPEQDRLPTRVIDIRAARTPERTFAYLPKGTSIEDGFEPFTYRSMARAIDAVAWWLEETFGKGGNGNFPTIPYIGANDIRYALLVFASVKAGYKLLVPLMYNTPAAQVNLLTQCQAEVVVASAGYEKYFDAARAAMKGLRMVTMPEAEFFLSLGSPRPYPYRKTVAEGLDDPLMVIQTSGTTGNPKPLHHSCRYVAGLAARLIETHSSGPHEKFAFEALTERCLTPNLIPISWGLGLWQISLWPLIVESIPLLLPASIPQPMPAECVHRLGKYMPESANIGAIFVPDVLKEVVRHPDYLEGLKIYRWIGFAGAPLDHKTGDAVHETGIHVQSILGSTDAGAYPTLLNESKDWELHRFKEYAGFHMQQFTEDTYELCVTREPDDDRPCFLLNPHSEVYHTKDLWRKVPGRDGFWTMAGRVDDFVKLASMTKFNATEIERIVERHPGIEKTIVAGDARPRPYVLVEPKAALRESFGDDQAGLIRHLWPQFEMANQHIYRDARLTDALVLITKPDKPIIRTAKGTANRRSTLALYEEEIEAMYSRSEC